MALDLILASQGGVCKIMGTECCTFILDSSKAVHVVVTDTGKGIKDLHQDHGWNPPSYNHRDSDPNIDDDSLLNYE